MSVYWAGLAAGFVAAIAVSAIMLMKDALGLMPEMDLIGMFAGILRVPRSVAWVFHFGVDTVVYGLAYAWVFAPIFPHAYWLSGILLGIVGWVIAGGTLMPLGGKGPYGVASGPLVPPVVLMVHVIFGVILGAIFGILVR